MSKPEIYTMQRQQEDTTSANKIEQGNQHPVDSSSDDEYIFSLGNIKTHAIKSKVKAQSSRKNQKHANRNYD
jgi:hypothetical protein